MKAHSTYLVCLLSLVITGTFISCNKDDDKKPVCRIVTIMQTEGANSGAYNLTYNNDGKISTLSLSGSSGNTKVFTYSGNTINTITTASDGSFDSRDSITLDNKQRPLNIRRFTNKSGTSWTNYSFVYNGDDLLKYTQTSSSSSTPETTTATYINGNMVGIQNASSLTTVDYFTDKKAQPGDYLEVLSLVEYGVSVYPHKNLVKSIASSGGSVTNFNYEFNNDGQISKVVATSGGTLATLTYQYQCK